MASSLGIFIHSGKRLCAVNRNRQRLIGKFKDMMFVPLLAFVAAISPCHPSISHLQVQLHLISSKSRNSKLLNFWILYVDKGIGMEIYKKR